MSEVSLLQSYEAPELSILGSFEEITLANSHGTNLDSSYSASDPLAQEVHS